MLRRQDWEALKKALIDDLYIGIETGQAKRGTDAIDESGDPAQFTHTLEAHSYITSAGAAPNDTMSDRLSYSAPNSLWV